MTLLQLEYLWPFVAYLLGSFSSAVVIGKLLFKYDVREHGSGNAGATNTLRLLGFKAAIPVFILDALKGYVAINLPVIFGYPEGPDALKIVLATAVLFGHIYPVFSGFRGGKGVATMLGIALALSPLIALCALAVFALTLAVFRWVAVSSMLAGLSLLVWGYIFDQPPAIVYFLAFVGVGIVFSHRSNIARLRSGEEEKVDFKNLSNSRH